MSQNQIEALQELNDLLAEKNHWRTMGDAAQLFENAGYLTVYDTAMPQAWFDDVLQRTGEPPYGVVWSYHAASVFGRPLALTQRAQRVLTAYRANGGRP